MKPLNPLHLSLLVPLALAGVPSAVFASTLYRCADESGVVLYTNQKTANKNCTVLSVQVPPTSAAAAGPRPRPANGGATPTPSDFPRVSNNEQKSRDGDRRAILERELANETASLEKARQVLPATPTQAARDTVALHERNIEALNKELGKLR